MRCGQECVPGPEGRVRNHCPLRISPTYAPTVPFRETRGLAL